MVRYLRKPCLHGARVSLIGSLSFFGLGWGVNVGDCVVGVLLSINTFEAIHRNRSPELVRLPILPLRGMSRTRTFAASRAQKNGSL